MEWQIMLTIANGKKTTGAPDSCHSLLFVMICAILYFIHEEASTGG